MEEGRTRCIYNVTCCQVSYDRNKCGEKQVIIFPVHELRKGGLLERDAVLNHFFLIFTVSSTKPQQFGSAAPTS